MIENEQLLGRSITVLWGLITNSIIRESTKKDKLGKWLAFQISNGHKIILFITIYQIRQGIDDRVSKSILQYNEIAGRIYTVTKYRKEVFREILNYKASLNNINNIIIRGNFNQDINSSKVNCFLQIQE